MYCVNCGSPLPDDGVCPACGQVHQMPNRPTSMLEQGYESETVLPKKERIKRFLFPKEKRMNRKRFIIRNLSMYALLLLLFFVVGIGALAVSFLVGESFLVPAIVSLIFFLLYIPMWVYGIFLSIWRLHDLNLSGWYLVPINLIFFFLEFMDSYGGGETFFELLSILFSIFLFALLFCIRGTKGPNKYGEDPLAMTGEK